MNDRRLRDQGLKATTNIPEIWELWNALAVDAINVQLRFDRYFEDEIQRFVDSATETQITDQTPPMVSLAPRQLRIAQFDFNLLVAISTGSEQEFAVRALPLNSEFFIRTQATVTKQSRLSISVDQVPLNKE